jgi:hypothetical protein
MQKLRFKLNFLVDSTVKHAVCYQTHYSVFCTANTKVAVKQTQNSCQRVTIARGKKRTSSEGAAA